MIGPLSLSIILYACFHGVFISRPGPPGHTPHNIPGDGASNDTIDPFTPVENESEAAVDGVSDAHAPAVVQRHQAHPSGGVAGKTMGGHVRHNVAPVFDVGRFSERRVRAPGIVMVSAEHHRSDVVVSDHLVES